MATLTLDEQVQKFARENGISGYEGVSVGRGSERYLLYPDAVSFAEGESGRLQSVRDAVVVRVASNGADGSSEWQHTSDFALYSRLGGVNGVVFVDGYDFVDNQNRSLISRCQEGFDALIANPAREWLLPFDDVVSYFSRSDDRVPSVLLPGHFYVDGNDLGDDVDARNVWCDIQAERGRVFVVPKRDLVLPTRKPSVEEFGKGVRYFGNHPFVNGLLGGDVARVYSDDLFKQGYGEGHVRFPDRGVLNSIPDGSVLCRSVGLQIYFNGIDAQVQSDVNGRARGLVHAEETAQIEAKK